MSGRRRKRRRRGEGGGGSFVGLESHWYERLRRCKKEEDKIKDQRCDEMGNIIREK